MSLSPYIAMLRRHVGHDMLLIPGAAVVIRDDAGRLLLIRQHDSGEWAMIGGALEPLEIPEEGARREALEEAGVTVRIDGLLGVFGGPDQVVHYPNGDAVAYLAVIYAATIVDGVPHPDHEETTEVAWFRPDDAAALTLSPNTRATLHELGIL